MTATQHFKIILPNDLAEVVERKLKSGHYASVSEVFSDGVRALMDHGTTIEAWLREEVVAGHAEYVADPSRGVPADEILSRIKDRRQAIKDQ